MKLYYTPNSPYARMCRITAIEGGLGDALKLEWVTLREADSPLVALSPMGRVPLLHDGDVVLSEGRHICAYLDEKAGTHIVASYGDWEAVAAEAQALAFLDAMTVWAREVRRPEELRSLSLRQVADAQLGRQLAHYDETLTVPEGDPPLSFESLCIVAAMDMSDLYSLMPYWRENFPNVAHWVDAYHQVPSIAATAPSPDAIRPLTR